MSREKQIEEMEKYLETIFPTKGIVGGLPIKIKHDYKAYAELFFNAGYRKASDVAREIFEEIERVAMSKIDANLSIAVLDDTYYIEAIDELKKKYTEEGK